MTAPIVKAILGRTETRGECPCCGSAGMPGASCDACVRAAYQNELARALRCIVQAAATFGIDSQAATLLGREHQRLLHGLVGHDLIRDLMPHARMQAPEAP